ncbi:MAG TPA: hypothetical protein VNM14_21145 [Planctomycetota bacterium]|jgi:hypothetical protein|nr:hypothetical protein [Planctomycetota bacterium]
MRLALLLFLALQAEAPVAKERERIRAKAPLTDAQKAEYASPEGPAAKPRASYTLTVVPLEFSDRKLGTRDLQKLVFGGVAEYFTKASAGRFKLDGKVAERVALEVERAAFERRDLEKALGVLPACDGVAFVTAGGLSARGTPLWPHRGVVRSGAREVDYLLVPEEAAPAIVAHEFMHLLGFADKYDDEKASVADACILGTGYSVKNPPPPCVECRIKLGWASAALVDPTRASAVQLSADPTRALRIPLTVDDDEALLLEMRDRLFVWHLGGGRKIELVGRYPSEASDRLTPLSEPSFRGRSLGARPVWITDIRVEDGKAWFRVGPEAPLTALEEWRRSHVGKRLGD